jgi:predicted DNA-binding protein
VADINGAYDENVPVSREEAANRRAVEWAMTHDLSDQFPGDEAASAELAAQLPTAAEPVTAESVDAMLVTTSLRIPLGTQRRVQAYAEAHGIKPTALMRQWIEQMLAAVERDHPISLQDALRALAQLPPPAHGGRRAA